MARSWKSGAWRVGAWQASAFQADSTATAAITESADTIVSASDLAGAMAWKANTWWAQAWSGTAWVTDLTGNFAPTEESDTVTSAIEGDPVAWRASVWWASAWYGQAWTSGNLAEELSCVFTEASDRAEQIGAWWTTSWVLNSWRPAAWVVTATVSPALAINTAYTEGADTLAAISWFPRTITASLTESGDTVSAAASEEIVNFGQFHEGEIDLDELFVDDYAQSDNIGIQATLIESSEPLLGLVGLVGTVACAYTEDADTLVAAALGLPAASALFTEAADTFSAQVAASLVLAGAHTESNDALAAQVSSPDTLSGGWAEAQDTLLAIAIAPLSLNFSGFEANELLTSAALAELLASAGYTEQEESILAVLQSEFAYYGEFWEDFVEEDEPVDAGHFTSADNKTIQLFIVESDDQLTATGGSVGTAASTVNEALDLITSAAFTANDAHTLIVENADTLVSDVAASTAFNSAWTESNETASASAFATVAATCDLIEVGDLYNATAQIGAVRSIDFNVTEGADAFASDGMLSLFADADILGGFDLLASDARAAISATLDIIEVGDLLLASSGSGPASRERTVYVAASGRLVYIPPVGRRLQIAVDPRSDNDA